MAVSFVWPLGLPQAPDRGFTESKGLNVLRTPMDAGPAKMRKRSVRPDTMNVSYLLTTNQVSTLETFVFTTLQGTYRFGWPHPRTNVQVEARVVPSSDGAYYSITYAAPGYWRVSLQLEILP